MKILATSDVHQMIQKWKDLVKICQNEKFDIIAIAGDLFPNDQTLPGQLNFMPKLKKYANKINETGAKIVIMLGNDDNSHLIPMMETADKEGYFHYIPEKVVEIYGHEFIGMPWVPDYPFQYKFWCRGETKDNVRMDNTQYGDPLLLNKDNKFETIPDYYNYLKSNKTIWDSLVECAGKVKDMSKSIWLIHAPPSYLELDVCSHGARVGSQAVFRFVNEYHPLLTIHGHIHESPQYNGYVWFKKVNKTTCIQGGQIGFKLHYTTIDIQDGNIVGMKHSIYGEDLWNYSQRV